MSQAEWCFMKAKLALAVAIIKNKPPGVSSGQYAQALGRQLKARDESRKEKAQGLTLRQEVLMAKLTSLMEAADFSGRMNGNSQDLFGPGSAEPEDDAGSETPDLDLSPNTEPVAGCSTPPIPSDRPASPQSDVVLRHTRFLQSLGSLQWLKGCEGMETPWFGPDGDGALVLEDTLSELLDFVAEGRGSVRLGSGDYAVAACQAAAQATDLLGSRRSAKFTSRVGKRLKELIGMLLNGDQTSGLGSRGSVLELQLQNLKRCLMVLGSSSSLRSLLIRHVMSELTALTNQLWQVIQITDGSGIRQFPVIQYQNSRHLFSILEELLQQLDVTWQNEAGAELKDFQRCMEERVFPLSEEFHVFSLRMWRLGGLIKDPTTPLSLRHKHPAANSSSPRALLLTWNTAKLLPHRRPTPLQVRRPRTSRHPGD